MAFNAVVAFTGAYNELILGVSAAARLVKSIFMRIVSTIRSAFLAIWKSNEVQRQWKLATRQLERQWDETTAKMGGILRPLFEKLGDALANLLKRLEPSLLAFTEKLVQSIEEAVAKMGGWDSVVSSIENTIRTIITHLQDAIPLTLQLTQHFVKFGSIVNDIVHAWSDFLNISSLESFTRDFGEALNELDRKLSKATGLAPRPGLAAQADIPARERDLPGISMAGMTFIEAAQAAHEKERLESNARAR